MNSYEFWKARNRVELLVEMQDNINEFGELTSDEGKKDSVRNVKTLE